MPGNEKKLMDQSSSFREVKDIPDDGNCGYHSIQFGLEAIEKTNSLKSLETIQLKKILYDHVKIYFMN